MEIGEHANIVRYFGAWQSGGFLYVQMGYCSLGTLKEYALRLDELTPEELWTAVADVAAGLQHIHSKGKIHLDLKPGTRCFPMSAPQFASPPPPPLHTYTYGMGAALCVAVMMRHDRGLWRVFTCLLSKTMCFSRRRGCCGLETSASRSTPTILRTATKEMRCVLSCTGTSPPPCCVRARAAAAGSLAFSAGVGFVCRSRLPL